MSKKYKTPPIEEALCEIYFEGGNWDATTPGVFFDRIKTNFPNKQPLTRRNVHLEFEPESVKPSFSDSERMRFLNADNSQIVQIESGLLVVNQLRPYPENFEAWKPRVLELIRIFQEIISPKGISYLGVRFINKIVLPVTNAKMEDYFRIYPTIPEDLAPHHGEFLMRVDIPPTVKGHQLMVSFSSALGAALNNSVFALDLYDRLQINRSLELDQIASSLTDAHRNVEHAFERSITNLTRETLFGEISK